MKKFVCFLAVLVLTLTASAQSQLKIPLTAFTYKAVTQPDASSFNALIGGTVSFDTNNFPATFGSFTGVTPGQPGISQQGWPYYWNTNGTPAWSGFYNFQGVGQIGFPYLMPAGASPMKIYTYGNPADQRASQSTADGCNIAVNMNPFTSGSGWACSLMTTTPNGTALSTNLDGIPIYLKDTLAISLVEVPEQGPRTDLPGYGEVVMNGNEPFSLCNATTVGATSGNYSWLLTDPSARLLHFPLWTDNKMIPGDSGWKDVMTINNNTGDVLVYGNGSSLFHLEPTVSLVADGNIFLASGQFFQFAGNSKITQSGSAASSVLHFTDGNSSDVVTVGYYGVQCLSGGLSTATASKATSYSMIAQDSTILVTATGQTITLPSASAIPGRQYSVKLTAAGTCTVSGGGVNIDGAATFTLSAQYKYVTVQSNGTQYWIVANN